MLPSLKDFFLKAFWSVYGAIGALLYLLLFVVYLLLFVLAVAAVFLAVAGLLVFLTLLLEPGLRFTFNALANGPRRARALLKYCRETWTTPRWQLGWRSLKGFADSQTPLLTGIGSTTTHDQITLNALCVRCYDTVAASKLIRGSIFPLIRRRELHRWELPLYGQGLSGSACHLCRILWYAIAEDQQRDILSRYTGQRFQACVAVWKERGAGENSKQWIQICYAEAQPTGTKLPLIRGKDTSQLFVDAPKHATGQYNGGIAAVDISSSTGSLQTMEQAKSWIFRCESRHECCKGLQIAGVEEVYVPLRLLYTAFSYFAAYNRLPMRHKFTFENRAERQTRMYKRDLPLSFQHAITVTRRLGISYVWIEALCILHDSYGTPNAQEIDETGNVYSHAVCTISACGSTDMEDGLFHNRGPSYEDFPCHIRFSRKQAITVVPTEDHFNDDSFCQQVDRSPWMKSARALEARLVSRRLLHFGSKFLFFECNACVASEAVPEGLSQPRRGKQSILSSLSSLRTKGSAKLHVPEYSDQMLVTWKQHYGAVIESFRNMQPPGPLNEEVDVERKLHRHAHWMCIVSAISSVESRTSIDSRTTARTIAQAVSGPRSIKEYRHGLWVGHIIFDLLWFICDFRSPSPQPPYPEPTWSWLAVDGLARAIPFSQSTQPKEVHCSLIPTAELLSDNPNAPSGIQTDHLLTLRCHVLSGIDIKYRSIDDFMMYIVTIVTPYEKEEALLRPDTTDFSASHPLFCAELVREVYYASKDRKERMETWSNGLLLRKTDLGRLDRPVYQRVGRFWMQWPMNSPVAGKGGLDEEKILFDRNRRQLVRII